MILNFHTAAVERHWYLGSMSTKTGTKVPSPPPLPGLHGPVDIVRFKVGLCRHPDISYRPQKTAKFYFEFAVNVFSSSSSSSRDEYYLGGTIALLLQDHRTMSTTGSV